MSESQSENQVSSAAAVSETIPFRFSGVGFEYFKIWIVNILLTIVTLGIYSAWAKVRYKQYFYGNTIIANAKLEYTAEPLKILKGRLIAFAIYMGFAFSGHISPVASVVMFVLLLAFFPWIIVSSLRFNARHTSYRNMSFRFHGTVWDAVKYYLLWPIVGMLTIGLLFPVVWKKQMQYITNNHAYGTEKFNFEVDVMEYYKLLFVMIGVTVAYFGALFLLVFKGATIDLEALKQGHFLAGANMIAVMVSYIAFYLFIGTYLVVNMVNIHVNNTQLKAQKFTSNWNILSYMWLFVSNTIAVICTVGLFLPFAKVRSAHYRAEHTAVITYGNVDEFIASELEQTNAVGEGVHDIFDIDISL